MVRRTHVLEQAENFKKYLNNDMNELNAVYVENAELLGINNEDVDTLTMYKNVITNDIVIGNYFLNMASSNNLEK